MQTQAMRTKAAQNQANSNKGHTKQKFYWKQYMECLVLKAYLKASFCSQSLQP